MAFPNDLVQKMLKQSKRTLDGDYYNGTIDIAHQKNHEGTYYTANFQQLAVADTTFARLRMTTGSKYAHFTITVNCEGKCRFKTYSGTTFSAAGTLQDGTNLTVFARKTDSAVANTTLFRFNPTINVIGATRGLQTIMGGSGPQSIGTSGSDRSESILAPNSELLIELQNVSGQPKDLNIIVEFYET